jgi:adenine-specific DNA methylase
MKEQLKKIPKTRYQGSKYKLKDWIYEELKEIKFDVGLDAFSGTGTVSYIMKALNKKVYTNDKMKFNTIIAKALIENNKETISDKELEFVLKEHKYICYDNFIERTFKDIYYTKKENKELDIIIQNIMTIDNEYKQAILYWILFQACISKRPYNLFHRKNLYVRTADVKRSFGNKKTWDKPFKEHFKKFQIEINNAIFNNDKGNKAFNSDFFELDIPQDVDLIYFDTPYIPQKGSITKYNDFYHFLEGIVNYYNWKNKIDYNSKNKKFKSIYNIWEDKKEIIKAFETMIKKSQKIKNIVISYRKDGIPTIEEIKDILTKYKYKIKIKEIDYKYVFSKQKETKEILIIAKKIN